MFILNQNQIKKCQFKIANQEQYSQGFLYLNHLFMEVGLKKIKEFKEAIGYDKTLLEQDEFCIILEESNSYSVWCLVPEQPIEIKETN